MSISQLKYSKFSEIKLPPEKIYVNYFTFVLEWKKGRINNASQCTENVMENYTTYRNFSSTVNGRAKVS